MILINTGTALERSDFGVVVHLPMVPLAMRGNIDDANQRKLIGAASVGSMPLLCK